MGPLPWPIGENCTVSVHTSATLIIGHFANHLGMQSFLTSFFKRSRMSRRYVHIIRGRKVPGDAQKALR